jgi:hypothetical protein
MSAVQKADPEEAPLADSDGGPIDILVIAGDDRISDQGSGTSDQ